MPWVQRKPTGNRLYWIAAGVASVLFGIFTGYALWGQTASLVTNVEHQLNAYESRVRSLEKRLQSIEASAGVDNASASVENTARVY
jgi:hypothetical protein